MSDLPVSVIVVSRGRPGLLRRCLTGISQLCHRAFEIVVVTDDSGLEAVHELGWESRLKLVPFDEGNISSARNEGIAASAGEIVAFIDDDAVPEPTWLCHLAAPFDDPGVSASGGFVIGRNGISFQWTARAVNARGEKVTLEHHGDAPFEPRPPKGYVTKLEGTNCAFRRSTLAAIGGFDPAFRFYMDETDLNLRLALAGARTVIVPLARVHHGYAASSRRRGDRAPLDLREIGASTAVFLRKHAPESDLRPALESLRTIQRRALLRYMITGGLEPRDVARLLEGLDAGVAEGGLRPIAPLEPLSPPVATFLRFNSPDRPGSARYIAGRTWNRARLQRQATSAVANGETVTVFRFSPTALPHRVRFHQGGWWEQVGGLFGPSDRQEPLFRLLGFRARVDREWRRVAMLRQCHEKPGRRDD